ncbi:MAG: hypothetical protein KBF88_00080 [Polyangiaceae bacterium]|nr:hypothetical protein [Polyangiaceae bacterium]
MHDEQAFRSLLGMDGFLLETARGTLATLENKGILVFAQRADARLELHYLRQSGARLFDCEIGVTTEKQYESGFPSHDAARFVVRVKDVSTTCVVYGRPTTEADWSLAASLEEKKGGGLGHLAKRCEAVWFIEGAEALRLAGTFASVYLGPVVPASREELLGMRSVRERVA